LGIYDPGAFSESPRDAALLSHFLVTAEKRDIADNPEQYDISGSENTIFVPSGSTKCLRCCFAI
jgi:hypothetical protein